MSSPARLVSVAVLAVVLLAVARLLFDDDGQRRVVAEFDAVNGLVEGGKVTVGGVRSGTVTKIALGPDGYPRVSMRVDGSVRLRTPVHADLRMQSLSGETNRFVNLSSGDGAPAGSRVVIGRADTDQPVEIDAVLATLDPQSRRDLGAMLGGFRGTLAGRGSDLGETLRLGGPGFGAIADAVNQATADQAALRGLLDRSNTVMGALAQDGTPPAVDGLADLLSATAARQAQLREAVARLAPGLAEGRAALDRLTATAPALDRIVRDAQPVADALPAFSRQLSGALVAAPPTLAQARALVAEAPVELRRLLPLIQAATPFLRRAAAVARVANPMLDRLRVAFPDAFNFFNNWANFSANYDINGHGGRVALTPAPGASTLLGPGDSGSGLLQLPYTRTPGVLQGEPWQDYLKSFVGGGR